MKVNKGHSRLAVSSQLQQQLPVSLRVLPLNTRQTKGPDEKSSTAVAFGRRLNGTEWSACPRIEIKIKIFKKKKIFPHSYPKVVQTGRAALTSEQPVRGGGKSQLGLWSAVNTARPGRNLAPVSYIRICFFPWGPAAELPNSTSPATTLLSTNRR